MDGGTPASVTPTPRRTGRGRWLGAALVVVVLGAALALVAGQALSSRHPSVQLGARAPGDLASIDELHDRAARAASGEEPYASAVADLVEYANATVALAPRPQEPLEIS